MPPRQIPWLRVFVEGVGSVRGVSLQSVSRRSAATLGEQLLGEVRLIPQALQFVLQQLDPFVLLGQTGILVRCRRRKQLTSTDRVSHQADPAADHEHHQRNQPLLSARDVVDRLT